jgi:hypothetical protein
MLDQLLKQENKEAVKIRGFYRVHIQNPDGAIVGDSGWLENQITDSGVRYYMAYLLGAIAGSLQVTHLAIGSGTVPASNATSLDGEVVKRQAVTAASSGSTAVQFTGTFSSTNSFVTNTQNISNIGLFNSSSTGTLFAGNTYASSSCATNQNVNTTYTITFTR